MSGWRGLFGAALQWTLIVPFPVLCLLVLSVIPETQAPAPALVGRWTSTQADAWAGKPLIDLDLRADGAFELTLYPSESERPPAAVRGDYTLVHGALVLRVAGSRMVWRVGPRAAALSHRTDLGVALSLEPALSEAPAAAPVQYLAASAR